MKDIYHPFRHLIPQQVHYVFDVDLDYVMLITFCVGWNKFYIRFCEHSLDFAASLSSAMKMRFTAQILIFAVL